MSRALRLHPNQLVKYPGYRFLFELLFSMRYSIISKKHFDFGIAHETFDHQRLYV